MPYDIPGTWYVLSNFRVAAAFRGEGAELPRVNSSRYLVYVIKTSVVRRYLRRFFSRSILLCFFWGGVVWVMDFVFWAPSVRVIPCGLDRD